MPHVNRPGNRLLKPELKSHQRGPLTGANVVDPSDPAFGWICHAAKQLREFGYDPNDPDVAARAIEVGRKAYEESPEMQARRRSIEVARGHDHPGGFPPDSVVYYMRVGNRVKIGWSTNLEARLATFNPEELMAFERGGRSLEKSRHSQFRELHTHGEWFRLEANLVDHIEKLRHAENVLVDIGPASQ